MQVGHTLKRKTIAVKVESQVNQYCRPSYHEQPRDSGYESQHEGPLSTSIQGMCGYVLQSVPLNRESARSPLNRKSAQNRQSRLPVSGGFDSIRRHKKGLVCKLWYVSVIKLCLESTSIKIRSSPIASYDQSSYQVLRLVAR